MNIRLKIQYDGTNFSGSQIQPAGRTVQGELNSALEKIYGNKISTVFSGRTDSGVHAREQIVNFSEPSNLIPPDRVSYALNGFLPYDIYAISSTSAPDSFNARFDAKLRTYRYFFRKKYDLFRNRYSLFCPFEMNKEILNRTAKLFIGQKDFKSFCSTHAEVNSHTCNVKHLLFFKKYDELVMEISSDRFLQNMVRIIASVFIEISKGRMTDEDIISIFEKRDRRSAPKTISPKGLFLWKVDY